MSNWNEPRCNASDTSPPPIFSGMTDPADPPNPLDLPGWLALTLAFVAVAAVLVAWRVWGAGVRAYQSTGS